MALAEQFSKPTWTRYKVLLWLGGAATIAYICRNSLSVAEKGIREDLGLDAFQMGLVMGAFQISYALLQIPSGHFTAVSYTHLRAHET